MAAENAYKLQPAYWTAVVIVKLVEATLNSSPLVLDLDGDGIELVSLADSTVMWDIDGDDFLEHSGWVQSDDGLLALDRNGDGAISDSSELFGSNSRDGFSILAALDDNNDGVINRKDSVFGQLRVWRDLDQDGASRKAELFRLKALGITEIDVVAKTASATNAGHDVSHVSTFTMTDGSGGVLTRAIEDIWFNYDNTNSLYRPDFDIDLSVVLLPDLRGYGNIPHLRLAMMEGHERSDALRPLVAQLDGLSFAQMFRNPDDTAALVRDILFTWAGVDQVDPDSRGAYIDARMLHFLEAFTDEPFRQRGYSPDPFIFASRDLMEGFDIAYDNAYARLLAQTSGHLLFDDEISYDNLLDSFSGGTTLNATYLAELANIARTGEDALVVWQSAVRMIEFTVGVSALKEASKIDLNEAIKGSVNGLDLAAVLASLDFESFAGGTFRGTNGDDTLAGRVGDDFIYGDYGDDTLNGRVGADTINGGGGDDTLIGGIGADLIRGSFGADIYRYARGHGVDTYAEEGHEHDTILLGKGIKRGDLTIERVSNGDLRILIAGEAPGAIYIEDQFTSGGHIETIQLNSGARIELDQTAYTLVGSQDDDRLYGVGWGGLKNDTILGGAGNDIMYAAAPNQYGFERNKLLGQLGDDSLYGDRGADRLLGGGGDDYIAGNLGNDIITGGRGDDILYDAGGDDTYRFARGDGIDHIEDIRGEDVLAFGKGITESDISAIRRGNSQLELQLDGGRKGTVLIDNQFDPLGGIETIRVRGGVTLDYSTTEFTTLGTGGADTIYGIRFGGSPVDRIYGRGGNDTIYAQGVNSYEFNANWLYGEAGNDRLYGGRGDDVLEGGTGRDVIQGYQGDDLLTGGRGRDKIYGGQGDDTYRFDYGDGVDQIHEEMGNDRILFGDGISVDDLQMVRIGNSTLRITVDGGAGGQIEVRSQFDYRGAVETLEFADGSTLDLTATAFVTRGTERADSILGIRYGGSAVDRIYGGGGNDTIYAEGANSYDYTANWLYGENGNDWLYGGRGDDVIEGGEGNDYLYGDLGDDLLTGGAGNDQLYGAQGTDTFVYSGGRDTILDFDGDLLHLSTSVWGDGAQTVGEVMSFATVTGSNTLFVFDEDNRLLVDGFTDLAAIEAAITLI
ncbi:calcium-binding protein [Arenibacterium halophilum]|nr:calcium-binding protein [Arenibacterium halophilum]